MDWREIHSSEQSQAFGAWFDELPDTEKASIRGEMLFFLQEIVRQRQLSRRQVDKPSTRRKRRPVRHG